MLDPQFFAHHKGKRLRFSQGGVDFHDLSGFLKTLSSCR